MDPEVGAVVQSSPTPEEIREATQRILERPEFSSAGEGWLDRLWRAIDGVLNLLAGWAAEHPAVRTVFTVLLIAVLLGLIALIIVTYVRGFASARPRAAETLGASVSALLEGESSDWDSAFAVAERALAAGHHYRAVWIGHRLYLALLDFAGVIKFARWKTNSDYLDECRHEEIHRAALGEFNATYEDVVYAHRAVETGRIERFLGHVAEMRKHGKVE